MGQVAGRREQWQSSEELDSACSPIDVSDVETSYGDPNHADRPASAEKDGLETNSLSTLTITNLTICCAAAAPGLKFLTAILRNITHLPQDGGAQIVRRLLMETMGNAEELEDIACQPLGSNMVLVTATARCVLPARSARGHCDTSPTHFVSEHHPLPPSLAGRRTETIQSALNHPSSDMSAGEGSDSDVGYVHTSSICKQKRHRIFARTARVLDLDSSRTSDSDTTNDSVHDRTHMRTFRNSMRKRSVGTVRRWRRKEEAKLLAYVREGMSWRWIGLQFPGRSQSGVYQHYYTVLKKKS